MASTFTHALVGYSLTRLCFKNTVTTRLLLLGMFAANAPDLDVVGYHLGYDDLHYLGHRGISHSILVAVLVGPLLSYIWYWKRAVSAIFAWQAASLASAALLSHTLLDMLTDGNVGVAALAPFDTGRYFFAGRLLVDTPMYDDFIQFQSVRALASEFIFVWIPVSFVHIGVFSSSELLSYQWLRFNGWTQYLWRRPWSV